jgi:hypothetical protein
LSPFFENQTLYPTELRARAYIVYYRQLTAISSSISTSAVYAFASH